MVRKKRLYRIAVISAALVAVGATGATLSQAEASQTTSCGSGSGLLSVATSALCAATTGVGTLLGSATGGATTPVTSAVTSVTSAATGTVGSLTGSQQTTATGTSGSSGSSGTSGSSTAGSGSSSTGGTGGTTAAGTAVSAPTGTTAGSASSAAAALAAALAAQRADLASQTRRQSLLAIPAEASSGQATSVRLGPSQAPAYRQVLSESPFWRTTPLSVLTAIVIGLAVGIGIVYAGWRNGDLLGRRRRSKAQQYARRPAESTPAR